MALNTPQFGIPTSLVFGVRDFSKDIRQNQAEDTDSIADEMRQLEKAKQDLAALGG